MLLDSSPGISRFREWKPMIFLISLSVDRYSSHRINHFADRSLAGVLCINHLTTAYVTLKPANLFPLQGRSRIKLSIRQTLHFHKSFRLILFTVSIFFLSFFFFSG